MIRALARRGFDALRSSVDRLRAARTLSPRRIRLERFGAIVQLIAPRALVFVDRAFARESLGIADAAIWDGPE
ncbi:MAG: hypothetical protein ABI867_32955, partial [Kofleriaceae bacterium]